MCVLCHPSLCPEPSRELHRDVPTASSHLLLEVVSSPMSALQVDHNPSVGETVRQALPPTCYTEQAHGLHGLL